MTTGEDPGGRAVRSRSSPMTAIQRIRWASSPWDTPGHGECRGTVPARPCAIIRNRASPASTASPTPSPIHTAPPSAATVTVTVDAANLPPAATGRRRGRVGRAGDARPPCQRRRSRRRSAELGRADPAGPWQPCRHARPDGHLHPSGRLHRRRRFHLHGRRWTRRAGFSEVAHRRRAAEPAAAGRRPSPPTTAADTPVQLDLLAQASDPDGDPVQLAALTLPSHGQLTVNPDRTVTYDASVGLQPATDMFTYTVEDGRGGNARGRGPDRCASRRPLRRPSPTAMSSRRRIVVPPRRAGGESATSFVLLSQRGRRLAAAAAHMAAGSESACGLISASSSRTAPSWHTNRAL